MKFPALVSIFTAFASGVASLDTTPYKEHRAQDDTERLLTPQEGKGSGKPGKGKSYKTTSPRTYSFF